MGISLIAKFVLKAFKKLIQPNEELTYENFIQLEEKKYCKRKTF